jgi:hypothetical protein
MITQQTETGAAKIIAGLDDITLVDTSVEITRIRPQPRACLFSAESETRPVTVVSHDYWGDLLVKTGQLDWATIQPDCWSKQQGPWELRIKLIYEPGNKYYSPFSWGFPTTPVLLMWGTHKDPTERPP